MKRFRLWVRELSLIQQMLCIIFLFVAVFSAFIVFILAPALDSFTETEMYNVLHKSQYNWITMEEIASTEKEESAIFQILYDVEKDEFEALNTFSVPDDLYEDIRKQAALQIPGTQDYRYTVPTVNDRSDTIYYLYSMTMLQNDDYLISIMPNVYRLQASQSMVSSVIMINIFVVSLLFVLLLIWVGSLIYPLSLIKNYITKIKNDEEAELSIKRNDEIGQVADALTEMEKELAKQNAQKQEMIQNISHDLKTPIATIKSYAEAISDGIYPYQTLEKSCDVIIEHATRLEKKVKSLIVLNKMDYLLDDCPPGDALDMNRVIEKAVMSLQAVRSDIEIVTDTQPGVKFHGDEEPWRITVENLIDNALRYADTKITVSLQENELRVINDGNPIEEDRLSSLFHPYEKGTGGQFGLGLSIVYRVCTTYGYHVAAENLPHGVCFRIWKESTRKPKKRNMK